MPALRKTGPLSQTYVTLTQERIDLSGLTRDEREFLGKVVRAYQDGEAFPNFVNLVNAPGSPALLGGQWITAEVIASPLFRVCRDLGNRIGVAQGFLALGEHSSIEGSGFADQSDPGFLSCADAARQVGVTAEAIRRAIRESRLPASRVGRTYLLAREAVQAYMMRPARRP